MRHELFRRREAKLQQPFHLIALVVYICTAMLNSNTIKKYASEAGFTLCGVARARVLAEHADHYEVRLAASGDDALPYLARGWRRRLDPSTLVPEAKSVVVCALAYSKETGERDGGKVSAHRRDGDYHPMADAMLGEILKKLQADHPGLRGKICCDTSAVLEKAWAEEAGIGWRGRNSLVINPRYGSFILLGEIILADECDDYDPPYEGDGCGECTLCVDACPTGALQVVVPDHISRIRGVHTGRCIASLTIERGRLKDFVAEPIHGWIEGCDECLNACPHNI